MSIFSLGFLANREHRECTVCGIRISLTLGLICLQGRFSLCTKLGKKKRRRKVDIASGCYILEFKRFLKAELCAKNMLNEVPQD